MAKSFFRKESLPLIALDVCFIVLFINFFTGQLKPVADEMKAWNIVMGYTALLYSTTYLFLNWVKEIRKRTPGYWLPNLWAMMVFLICVFMGIAIDRFDVVSGPRFRWLTLQVSEPLGQAIGMAGSCLVLLLAIYRRFLATNWEAVVFIGAAFFTFFSSAPIFGYIWPGFDQISAIFLSLSAFGQAALLMAAVFGMIGSGVRSLIGRGGALMRVREAE